jgi:hypothetical protein
MPAPRYETRTRAAQAPRPDGQAASVRTAAPTEAGNGVPPDAPRPEETRAAGPRRGRSTERGRCGRAQATLHDLLRGLRAGDLECVLLTVAMAADENRMPSADPDEAARILAFLARLARYDSVLPPGPDGAAFGSEPALDAG